MENTASTQLYDLLVTRDFEPEILDSAGQSMSDPAQAELFSFDWRTDGRNYGTVVILLGSDKDLQVYYGDNLGRAMDREHRNTWYDFLAQLKSFASRNLMRFELNNINRLKYTMQGMAAIREGLFEGYHGRGRVSHSDQHDRARIRISHSRALGEDEPRHHAIDAIFIENSAGERFRVPSRNLMHGKILARHVAQGGTPYDAFGSRINQIMTDIDTLSRFLRAARRDDFDQRAHLMREAAMRHYADLKAKAKRMMGRRGYLEALGSFDPAEITQAETDVDHIRDMFVLRTVDPRIEQALPLLARLKETDMKEIDEFADWAHGITEGSWNLPQDAQSQQKLQDLLAEPLPVGPDAINATEQLYDIFGDDELFDRLEELAQRDAEADARDIIRGRLSELGIEIADNSNGGASISDDPVPDMGEGLDTDGVMMTRPSNMSSESCDHDLARLRRLALL